MNIEFDFSTFENGNWEKADYHFEQGDLAVVVEVDYSWTWWSVWTFSLQHKDIENFVPSLSQPISGKNDKEVLEKIQKIVAEISPDKVIEKIIWWQSNILEVIDDDFHVRHKQVMEATQRVETYIEEVFKATLV